MINGDLVRLGRPDDVKRDGTDALSIEFAQEVMEADPESRPVPVEYAYRLSFVPKDELLVPDELELWKERTHLLVARRDDAPRGVEASDGEVLLLVSPEANAGLPNNCWIGISGLQISRFIYPVDPAGLRESFDSLAESAREGDLAAIDNLWTLSVSRDVDEDLAEDLNSVIFQKLQDARFQSEVGVQFSKDERDHLFELYKDSEAPNGWVSEAIGRKALRRVELSPAWTARKGPGFTPLQRAIALLTDRAGNLAASALYLGPLREDPRVAYPLGHAASSLPVGEKGQFTAAFLERNRRFKPRYTDPEGVERRVDTLQTAVSRWCRYLDIGHSVSVKSEGKLGYQLMLTIDGRARDMTAIGVGASQLLPVVVLVLGAPAGALVLLEQPELHLHPAVQSRLANFFALARPDVSLLVETHSEYLITRLRRLVADGSIGTKAVQVLFAEQDEGVTRFDRLGLTGSGDFDHWPTGFFDTLDTEFVDIARAITRSEQNERE
ncbi:MAG TPA: AAA family ATPase [Solirubrobacterales bacterium]